MMKKNKKMPSAMEKVADFEIWRQIPPEEKIQIMSRAHANGLFTCVITVLIASTMAVGLRLPWMLWSSLIVAPLMFQLAAGKAWRALRPRIMLEYLAARSAARRYAFSANSDDLGISLIFRGEMQEIYDQENVALAMESMVAATQEAEVWIALFNDALVLMSEKKGGASCEFAALINDKLTVTAINPEDEGDYNNNKELIIYAAAEKNRRAKKVKLTSRFPAALVVFEKKLSQALDVAKAAKAKELLAFKEEVLAEADY
jgi:hypothetical protein